MAVVDTRTRVHLVAEIQELRHKSQSGDASSASRVIDQSLAALDERLDSVAKGVASVNESLAPILNSLKTPTIAQTGENDENAAILRKHADMISEWEALRKESEILREELKEDKCLTVFRTVTDQADEAPWHSATPAAQDNNIAAPEEDGSDRASSSSWLSGSRSWRARLASGSSGRDEKNSSSMASKVGPATLQVNTRKCVIPKISLFRASTAIIGAGEGMGRARDHELS